MSGLSHTPGKRAWGKTHRGFESRPLRQTASKQAPLGRFFVSGHQFTDQSTCGWLGSFRSASTLGSLVRFVRRAVAVAVMCASFDLHHAFKQGELFDLIGRQSLFGGDHLLKQALGGRGGDPGHF